MHQASPKRMLIMVLGLPGTGKSTFANALAEQIKAPHLNTDQVRHLLGLKGHYDEQSKALIYEAVFNESKELLKQHEALVVDGTFYKRALRQRFEALAKEMGAQIYWIEIRAAEAVVRQRVEHPRPFSEADFQVYQAIKKVFEPISEEPHLVLWSDAHALPQMLQDAAIFLRANPPEE